MLFTVERQLGRTPQLICHVEIYIGGDNTTLKHRPEALIHDAGVVDGL